MLILKGIPASGKPKQSEDDRSIISGDFILLVVLYNFCCCWPMAVVGQYIFRLAVPVMFEKGVETGFDECLFFSFSAAQRQINETKTQRCGRVACLSDCLNRTVKE